MEQAQELSFLSVFLPLIGIIFLIAIGVFLLYQHFHQNLFRQKLKQEELKVLYQQELLRSSIEVQEEERKRIALDLHDELGAVLSIAKMHLLQIEQTNTPTIGETLPALQNVRNLVETSLASMRRISHQLMPPQLKAFGLGKTLETIAEQTRNLNGLSINVICSANLPKLPWQIEVGLYRISMELIQNTIKHAEAQEANIELNISFNKIIFLYADNGKGLTNNILESGLGLKSIEARVTSMNGTLEIGKLMTKGFNARIELPFDANS